MPEQFTATVVATLAAEAARIRAISDALSESFDADAVVVSTYEAADQSWVLALHFRNAPNEAAVRALVAAAVGETAAQALKFETLAATDWVRESLAGLKPVEAGRFVVHGAHDRARIGKNRIGIEIEAGLAFGTGHHGTTRGCLLALDWIVKRGRSLRYLPLKGGGRPPTRSEGGRVGVHARAPIDPHPNPPPFRGRERKRCLRNRRRGKVRRATALDIGTGTGVLAIAAAKALRTPVLAIDIDAPAVRIARENARHNRVGSLVTITRANGLAARPFHARAPYAIVLANILLEPLRQMATPVARSIAPHGRVVLSGLLAAQSVPALAAYRARGLLLERRIPLEGWMTLVLRRPARPRRRIAARSRAQ